MDDPIEALGDEGLLLLAVDLQVQLEKGTALRPVLYLLSESRKKARAALLALAMDCDPEDTKKVRMLQNEVKLYDDMIQACRNLIARSKDARHKIREKDRDELDEIVLNMSDEERRLYGFEPRGKD